MSNLFIKAVSWSAPSDKLYKYNCKSGFRGSCYARYLPYLLCPPPSPLGGAPYTDPGAGRVIASLQHPHLLSEKKYTPHNEVKGVYLQSPCPSVRPSVHPSVDAWLGKMVQSHKCFPFTPIIMKLHIQTPDE